MLLLCRRTRHMIHIHRVVIQLCRGRAGGCGFIGGQQIIFAGCGTNCGQFVACVLIAIGCVVNVAHGLSLNGAFAILELILERHFHLEFAILILVAAAIHGGAGGRHHCWSQRCVVVVNHRIVVAITVCSSSCCRHSRSDGRLLWMRDNSFFRCNGFLRAVQYIIVLAFAIARVFRWRESILMILIAVVTLIRAHRTYATIIRRQLMFIMRVFVGYR